VDHSAARRTRRDAIRLLALGAVAVPALRPRAARAIIGWCRRDPIVQIDGQTAHILLSSYLEMDELATGPSEVTVTVPEGISARLLATDPGFAHFGYDVRFKESPHLANTDRVLEVVIEVLSPALDGLEGPLPVLVDFSPRGNGRLAPGQAQGLANELITLRTNTAAASEAPPSEGGGLTSEGGRPPRASGKPAKGRKRRKKVQSQRRRR
jgi:hypothetical protein